MELSQEGFDRARQFVHTQARPLEQALFAVYFEDGPADAVLDALGAHQNADGGFGQSLEPDFRLEASSPMATTGGFQVVRDMGIGADHPIVQRGIRYCLETYDAALERWGSVPEAVNTVPRAPWWGYDAEGEAKAGFRANPSAEIVGHLWHYKDLVPEDLLDRVTGLALAHMDTLPEEMEMHDLLCYLWLLEADHLPDAERIAVGHRMLQAAPGIVTRDPAQWGSYCVKPLVLAPLPASSLADVLTDEVQTNLDYEIGHQGEDGAWGPFWNWGGQHGDAWDTAEREWKGVLTVKVLRSLKAFGRMQNSK